jgi:hypothetical protein
MARGFREQLVFRPDLDNGFLMDASGVFARCTFRAFKNHSGRDHRVEVANSANRAEFIELTARLNSGISCM